jgi:tRNA modification GTPase
VEVRLVLAGYPVWIADTAGLREAADAIEAEGVRRALARAEEADLRIGVVEIGTDPAPALMAALEPNDIIVHSKADTLPGRDATDLLEVSAVTGIGLRILHTQIEERVAEALDREEAPVLTRARHRRLVEEARAALERAIPALSRGPELGAEDVRVAASAIGRLTGRIDVEDLLDEIFSSFCIGK